MEREYFLDKKENVNKIITVFFIICAVLLLVDVLDPIGLWTFKHHAAGDGAHVDAPRYHYGIEGWYGFYGIYGFVCCVALVLAAKVLRKIVMRGEDYYDR